MSAPRGAVDLAAVGIGHGLAVVKDVVLAPGTDKSKYRDNSGESSHTSLVA